MPERAKQDALGPDDWVRLAAWVRDEYATRKQNRSERESLAREVDRQIAMKARPWKPEEGMPQWYPATELPLQFNALEVNAADVRRLIFPRSGSWFKASAAITDDYRNRWDAERLKRAMIGDVPLEMNLDQETADILVKQTIEHYHKIYDFKASIGLAACEALKYGTGIVRVKKVRAARSAHEYRGQWSDKTVGPKVIPCSWWNTYLDDSWSALLHEGEAIGPTVIRYIGSQPYEDLMQAVEIGGKEEGWRKTQIKLIEPKQGEDGRKGRVELLECEGDLLVPSMTGSIYLPNSIVTVAAGSGGADVVRYKKNPMPFRSYVALQYFKHDTRHAYADSPLVKGEPLQEIATFAGNDFLAASRLRTLPPVAYDRNDPTLTADGGPKIAPQATWAVETPDAVKPQQIGDPSAALNAVIAFIRQHEDTTGSTEGRRGQRLKSHTTAYAADVEASQGISRTEDFVSDLLAGPLTTILHMEYEIAKDSMGTPQDIRIDAEGIDGWVSLVANDLADKVEFECVGSEGVLQEQQKVKTFGELLGLTIQAAGAAVQLGVPIPINFEALLREAYERAGVTNISKYIGVQPTIAGGAALEQQVPGIAQGADGMPPGGEAEALPAEQPVGPEQAGMGMGVPVGPV